MTDVKLENRTPIVYQPGNKPTGEVIFQCNIIGLDSNEMDFEINFDVPKCGQQADEQMKLYDPYTNGTIHARELHISSANAAHSGDYHCIVKLHTQQPNECMFVKTLAKTIDIQDIPNHVNTTAIATEVPPFVVLIMVILLIIIYSMRRRKIQQQHNQPELAQPQQPPGQEGHNECMPLVQESKKK